VIAISAGSARTSALAIEDSPTHHSAVSMRITAQSARIAALLTSLVTLHGLVTCGGDSDQQRSASPSELASSSASGAPSPPRLPPPQGQIAHIVERHIIDEECALTSAKEVYCWPWHAGSKPSSDDPIAVVPAVFEERMSSPSDPLPRAPP
jgi:hypothetical protein